LEGAKKIIKLGNLKIEANYLWLWTEVLVEEVKVKDDAHKRLRNEYVEDRSPPY
jgi:hypothetical protein